LAAERFSVDLLMTDRTISAAWLSIVFCASDSCAIVFGTFSAALKSTVPLPDEKVIDK